VTPERMRFATIVGFTGETSYEQANVLAERAPSYWPGAVTRRIHTLEDDLHAMTTRALLFENETLRLRDENKELQTQVNKGLVARTERNCSFFLLLIVVGLTITREFLASPAGYRFLHEVLHAHH
jgi:hypothetical protein